MLEYLGVVYDAVRLKAQCKRRVEIALGGLSFSFPILSSFHRGTHAHH